MFNSRYSEMEMHQWQQACSTGMNSDQMDSNATGRAEAAPRHGSSRATMAKGQAEKKQFRTAGATTQSTQQENWASECLFDWYNG